MVTTGIKAAVHLPGAAVGRRWTAALALLVSLSWAAPGWAQWAGWRGPHGLGVAPEGTPLATSWSPASDNLRWRTEIPGDGNSSPIIQGDRVFVTTAYEGSENRALWRALAVALMGITVLLMIAAARRRRTTASAGKGGGGRLVLGVSALFLGIALVVYLRPDLIFPLGNPSRVWRVSGAAALLGLAAAVGWARPGSPRRLWGSLAIVALGAGLVYWTPSTKLGPASLEKRLALLVPSAALAVGYLVSYLRCRRRQPKVDRWIDRPAPAVPMLLLAVMVFITPNYLDRLLRVVVCLDLETGRILWERPALAAPPEQKWRFGTYATPTPAADGQRVYAHFGAGLAVLDHDGRLAWRRQFPEYVRTTRYGAASSPVLTEEAVIVVQESEMYQQARPSWITAFDKTSGEELWRIEPPDARDSYATPMLVPDPGSPLLLTPSWETVVAYDSATGRRLWSMDTPHHQIVASAARQDDLIVLTGGVYDEKRLMALRLADDGPELLWETNRLVSGIPSPVLYRGLLFVVTERGILSCYRPETGEVLWKKRLDGEHYASLVAGDGKVYAVSREGVTSVIAAAPEYQLLATNEIGGAVMASPAVSPHCLVIRTERELVCIAPEG